MGCVESSYKKGSVTKNKRRRRRTSSMVIKDDEQEAYTKQTTIPEDTEIVDSQIETEQTLCLPTERPPVPKRIKPVPIIPVPEPQLTKTLQAPCAMESKNGHSSTSKFVVKVKGIETVHLDSVSVESKDTDTVPKTLIKEKKQIESISLEYIQEPKGKHSFPLEPVKEAKTEPVKEVKTEPVKESKTKPSISVERVKQSEDISIPSNSFTVNNNKFIHGSNSVKSQDVISLDYPVKSKIIETIPPVNSQAIDLQIKAIPTDQPVLSDEANTVFQEMYRELLNKSQGRTSTDMELQYMTTLLSELGIHPNNFTAMTMESTHDTNKQSEHRNSTGELLHPEVYV